MTDTTPQEEPPAATPDEPPKMVQHTPIQCVTIDGLMESYAALARLLNGTNLRIRDELAKLYGVAVGDNVRIGDQELRMDNMWLQIDKGVPYLGFTAKAESENSISSVTTRWNPDTCIVVGRGAEA